MNKNINVPPKIDNELELKEKTINKQYELAINILQNETGRFWNRFNIFIGIQSAGVIGIISNIEILTKNPEMFRLIMILFILISIFTVAMCCRGISTAKMLLDIAADLEKESLFLKNIISNINSPNKLPQHVNYIITSVTAFLFTCAWIISWVRLEEIDYLLSKR